ncbi:MAG: DUF4919 domain-containing protein, partial [Muribaculaceae bacterium]|nr:DUF4919 domain-containing protein [Muribaculaceae bacterium]
MKILQRLYILAAALLLPITGMMIPASAQQRRGSSKGETKKYKTEKPDLAEIQRTTLDSSSEYYYPKLMAKYEKKDTTMTPDEFRQFYLG